MNAIETRGLTKTFRGRTAVQCLNLSVKEGEIFGFVGPNGAGKSTTIRMLLNFLFPSVGSGSILGLDIIKNSKHIKQFTGYVSSEVRFYPNFTALQILNLVADFHRLTNAQRRIKSVIDLLEIDPYKRVGELSLGNKKKVAVAAGLLPKPRVLILDEPTNGLDPMIQHRLFEELERRNKKGATIFVSSHDLTEVQNHCSRAAFIKDGQIIAVEEIAQSSAREKIIHLKGGQLPLDSLIRAGASLQEQRNNQARLFFQGDIKSILPLLSDPNIEDLTISNLELEDKFFSLYEGGERQ